MAAWLCFDLTWRGPTGRASYRPRYAGPSKLLFRVGLPRGAFLPVRRCALPLGTPTAVAGPSSTSFVVLHVVIGELGVSIVDDIVFTF